MFALDLKTEVAVFGKEEYVSTEQLVKRKITKT